MMNQLMVQNHRFNTEVLHGEIMTTKRMGGDDHMEQGGIKQVRIHRVGSITLGFVLIVFGTLFLLHLAFPLISYQFIFHLWPTILISLGVEVLAANLWEAKEMRYDKGAVFLLMVMTFFTMCIAGMQLMMDQVSWHVQF